MGQLSDDVLKWTLDVNGSPARKELTQVSNDTNKLERANKSLATEMAKLEANGKKGSAEWKAYGKQIKANNATIGTNKTRMEQLRKEVGLNNLSSVELRKEMSRLKREMDRMDPNTAEWKKLNGEFQGMRGRLQEVNDGMKETNKTLGAFKNLLPAMGIAAFVSGAISIVKQMVAIRQEFEKYEAILTNSLGSQKEARKEMQMLQEFAAATPFSLAELTGAFVKLTNYGLKPTREELRRYGDLSSSVGKGFDQFVEAVADAVTGQFERLKEFGIKASRAGDKVTFTFKEQATQVDNTAVAIKNYMLSLGDLQGIAGSMEAISQTVGGKLSNMGDAWDNLLNKMGERTGGFTAFVIRTMTGMIDKVGMSLEILEADSLTFWEKWWGTTLGTDKIYRKLQSQIAAVAAKAKASTELKNLLGFSTADDIDVFGTGPKAGNYNLKSTENATKSLIVVQNTLLEQAKKLPETTEAEITAKNKKIAAIETEIKRLKELGVEKAKGGAATPKGPDYASMLAPEEENKISDFATKKMREETLIFAEKKRSEEEWTKFLKEQIDERTNELAKELEFEQEIAAARQDLNAEYIDAVGQIAGALSSMFEEGSAAQLAMLAIEKAAAIAQIIFQTGIANAKATAASPLTFGQPWVTINTVAAAASIAGIVATTVGQVSKSNKNKKAKSMADGGFAGYTGPGNKYDKKQLVQLHADEWVAPKEARQNPDVRQFIDIFEIARRSGQLARLNLSQIMQAIPSRSYAQGGYGSSSTLPPTGGVPAASGGGGLSSNSELKQIIAENTKAMKALQNLKVYTSIEDINVGQKNYSRMQQTRGLY